MWYEIFKFELQYRRKRMATWLYFFVMVLIGLLTTSTDVIQVGGVSNQLKENSPFTIAYLMLVLTSFFGTFMASAIMGVAIVRDFEHKTEGMFFTKPITKFDYIFGRFLGSFVILIFVLTGIIFGMALGSHWPGITEDFWPARDPEKLQAFSLYNYLHPFLVFVIPNAFITGALFFMVGGLSRRMVFIYLQAMLFLILQGAADVLLGDLDKKEIAAWVDPIGGRAFNFFTEYWTISEKNTTNVPMSGAVLVNRLIWIGIGILALLATLRFFSFNQVINPIIRRKPGLDTEFIKNSRIALPKVTLNFGFSAQLLELRRMTFFYFKNIIRDIPFIGIVATGLLLFIFNAALMDSFDDTKLIPTTYSMINLIQGAFGIFFFIITIMYAGELIWKERDVRINLIHDAMPVPTALPMIAKFLAMLVTYVGIVLILILMAIITQASKGYFNFEIGVYFSSLYGDTIHGMLLWLLMAFFVQIMVNNKIAGHAVMIVIFIAMAVISNLGVEHSLFLFNSASMGSYSDMNKYGHFLSPFSWLSTYWTAFTFLLFGLAVLFAVRGTEELFKFRFRIGKYRLTRPIVTFLILSTIVFVSSGAYVYYNTNVVNKYQNSKEVEKQRANYEKTLKKFEYINHPKITEAKLNVDIYPETRDFTAEGYFILKNKTDKPITEIHIQDNSDEQVSNEYIKFDKEAKLDNRYYKDFKYRIYKLSQPLQPQDSVKMSFKTNFVTNGFKTRGSNTDVVNNGTFFNNFYFPTIGYSENYELNSDDDRKKQGLKPKERMLEQNDIRGLKQNLLGDDGDQIRFEMTMSTAADQIAIAPGYLQKEWVKDGRKYFHYKMDAPMFNFYSMVSAKYAVKKENYKGISLEIYYHPEHTYNLDRMMKGMKTALDYYQANFSPYQYRQVRIMEFPRYASFAQSFANTIPFSEGIGFIMNITKEDDIDMPFYVTCHEVAHQWWGHQVSEANVKGNAMLSESMSQYSALMCMKKTNSREYMKKFLSYELNNYLRGRSTETKKEQPLELVERQGYIHYNKGSLVFYALQDYLGEEVVNTGIRNFRTKWNNDVVAKTGIYPISKNLIDELKAVTPDSMKYLYKDMFETITLFDNKADKVTYKEASKGNFKVKIDISAQKLRADSLGTESKIKMNDWVWVGVYGEKQKDKDRLIYYQRHKISKDKTTIEVNVKEKPLKAGIDPLNILIDRHPNDNTKSVEKE